MDRFYSDPDPAIMNGYRRRELARNPEGSISAPEPRTVPSMKTIEEMDEEASTDKSIVNRLGQAAGKLGNKISSPFGSSRQTVEKPESTT